MSPAGPGGSAGASVVISHLTHGYKGRGSEPVSVLRDASLSVEAGSQVALVGPSGSGKSTLLSILGGLETAVSGSVVVAGHDLSTLGGSDLAAYRRSIVGFVFQHFGLLETLTAAENVELACTIAGVSRSERRRRAASLLEEVGLSGRARHRTGELSGGERQRVAIARALANAPALLLARRAGPGTSTRSPAPRSGRCSVRSTPNAAPPCWLSRTTLRWPRSSGRVLRVARRAAHMSGRGRASIVGSASDRGAQRRRLRGRLLNELIRSSMTWRDAGTLARRGVTRRLGRAILTVLAVALASTLLVGAARSGGYGEDPRPVQLSRGGPLAGIKVAAAAPDLTQLDSDDAPPGPAKDLDDAARLRIAALADVASVVPIRSAARPSPR